MSIVEIDMNIVLSSFFVFVFLPWTEIHPEFIETPVEVFISLWKKHTALSLRLIISDNILDTAELFKYYYAHNWNSQRSQRSSFVFCYYHQANNTKWSLSLSILRISKLLCLAPFDFAQTNGLLGWVPWMKLKGDYVGKTKLFLKKNL